MALIGSLTSGVSALQSFSKGIEVIGNNIANVNTTGYKTSTVSYSDAFSNILQRASGSTAGAGVDTMQVGTGVQVAQISSVNTQGSINPTGVATDLAINGNGYFTVRDSRSNETFVTRAGNFTVDDAGYVLTADGQRLQGIIGGAISYEVTQDATTGALTYTPTITPLATTIGDMNFNYSLSVANGNIIKDTSVTKSDDEVNAGAPQVSSIAFDNNGKANFYMTDGNSFVDSQVLLTSFQDPNALVKVGANLFTNMAAAGPLGGSVALDATLNVPGTNGLGSFKTYALELSNVDLTQEFANLITTQRSFQAGSRIITVSDDILQEVVNLKR